MASELRKTILEANDLESEIVSVPEWGGVKIEIRSLNGKERAKLLSRASRPDNSVDLERWFPDLVIATAHDPETGEKVFEQADRDALNNKNGAVVSRLATIAQRLAGMMESDVEEAKRDFDDAQSDGSTSS